MVQITSPYPRNGVVQAKSSSLPFNPLEKVNQSISNFDGSGSIQNASGALKIQMGSSADHGPSSSNKTAHFDDKDAYSDMLKSSAPPSPIRSDAAFETSQEFIVNDYLSMKKESDIGMANRARVIQFYQRMSNDVRKDYRIPEMLQNTYMPHPLQTGFAIKPSFVPLVKRPEAPMSAPQKSKNGLGRPKFSGKEYVTSFKRQKIADTSSDKDENIIEIEKVSFKNKSFA